MNFRKTLIAAALGGAIGLPGAASALTIDGIYFEEGAIIETIDLFEGERNGGPITAVGQELIGIGVVNRILNASNQCLWGNEATCISSKNGRELTVYFSNYIAEHIETGVALGQAFAQIFFSGGTVEIYSDDTPNFSATGSLQDGIDSATDGDLFLSLAGSPVGGEFNGNNITLISTALGPIGGNPLLGSLNLSGRGLLDVTGGNAAQYFDTNQFGCVAADGAGCPDIADKAFTSSGQLAPSTASAWAFRGTGEVQDFAVIPEPGTLALLGAGLVGIAARRRKAA